ncbi:hypothetical protein REPUB_Repub07fG0047400 [Reevesia pubescens]
MLLGIGFDDHACKFLVPKITEFAADLAERRGAGEFEQGYGTVAEVGIAKADYIEEKELARFASELEGFGTCNIDESEFFNGRSDFMAEIDNSSSVFIMNNNLCFFNSSL